MNTEPEMISVEWWALRLLRELEIGPIYEALEGCPGKAVSKLAPR